MLQNQPISKLNVDKVALKNAFFMAKWKHEIYKKFVRELFAKSRQLKHERMLMQ